MTNEIVPSGEKVKFEKAPFLQSFTKEFTRSLFYKGQDIRDDIKILGHIVCTFVRMSDCVNVVAWWDDIKNLTVSLIKELCICGRVKFVPAVA